MMRYGWGRPVIEVRIEGLDALHTRIKNISANMRAKGARSAVRKGANVIRDAAKQLAGQVDRPETPLKIADNIAVQFAARTFRRTGDIQFRVGVRGGAKQYANTKENRRARRVGQTYATGGSTWYWRFVEFGTARSRARPFLRPAMENNMDRSFAAIVAEFNKQLDRFAKKGLI